MLNIKDTLKKIKNNYVITQVKRIHLPNFKVDDIRRYKITFKGRVQKVGFRLEVCELAKRLNLTGYCKNLENGDVLAELQGAKNKIEYLISYMESLKRIRIDSKVVEEIEIVRNEKDFFKQ